VPPGVRVRPTSRTGARRQVSRGIDRTAFAPDFEAKLGPIRVAVTDFGDLLAASNLVTLAHYQRAVVRIDRQQVVIVLDDNQVAVPTRTDTTENHFAICGCQYRIAWLAINGDTHVAGFRKPFQHTPCSRPAKT